MFAAKMPKPKMARNAKASNEVNVIHPYRTPYGGWVYDDPDIGVYSEAFVMGSSEVIDHLVGKKCNQFTATISRNKLPKYDARLIKIEEEKDIEGWYQLEGTKMKHWLCGCVLDYFVGYPDNIYVSLSNLKNEKRK